MRRSASRRALFVLGLLLVATALLPFGCGNDTKDDTLTVYAAASLTDVLPKVAEAWKAGGGSPIRWSWGATSELVPQVLAGAPADVVVSADAEWMDKLEAGGKAESGTRGVLARNELVIVVPAGSKTEIASPADLARPEVKRIALAGENVPAGKYAKAALTSLGAWAGVAGKVKPAEDVRGALRWVSMGEMDAGVVYRTDAIADPKVRVAFAFPAGSHPEIVYPAAVVKGSSKAPAAKEFLAFCRSPKGQAIFDKDGFLPAGP